MGSKRLKAVVLADGIRDVPVADPTVFTRTRYSRPSRRRFTDLDTTSAFIQDQFEITRYFEMLPPSPLRSLYEKMLEARDPEVRARLQKTLRFLRHPRDQGHRGEPPNGGDPG